MQDQRSANRALDAKRACGHTTTIFSHTPWGKREPLNHDISPIEVRICRDEPVEQADHYIVRSSYLTGRSVAQATDF